MTQKKHVNNICSNYESITLFENKNQELWLHRIHCFVYLFLNHRAPFIDITMHILDNLSIVWHRTSVGSIWSGRHARKSMTFCSMSYLLLFHPLGRQDISRWSWFDSSCNRSSWNILYSYPCRGSYILLSYVI